MVQLASIRYNAFILYNVKRLGSALYWLCGALDAHPAPSPYKLHVMRPLVSTPPLLLRFSLLGWVLLAVGCTPPAPLVTGPGATSAFALEHAPVERVVGEWEGTYLHYPHPMGLSVTLSAGGAAGDVLEGHVRFAPLVEIRDALGVPQGSFPVRGRYDPVTRTFELSPHGAERTPRLRNRPFAFVGVYDAGRGALAGELVHRGTRRGAGTPFTLMRPDVAEAALHWPMRQTRAESPAAALKRLPFGRILGGLVSEVPDDAALLAWASRLEAEYPGIDPMHTEMGRLYYLATNLLADEHFRPTFGTTFDRLGPGGRTTVADALNDAPRDGALAPYRALARAFTSTGSPGLPGVLSAYFARRSTRSWRQTALARLAALPPSFEALRQIDALEESALEHGRALWPSENAAFERAAGEARARVAYPALVASAEAVLATADGVEGARALASWYGQNAYLLRLVTPEQRAEISNRIAARLDPLLESVLATEVQGLRRLGRGVAAIQGGNAWYHRLQRRYGFASDHPAFREAVGRLQARRADDLAGAERDLRTTLAQLDRRNGVDVFVASTLAVPGDRTTPAGRRLLGAAEERKAEIRTRSTQQFIVGAALFVIALDALGREPSERPPGDAEQNCLVEGGLTTTRNLLLGSALRYVLPGWTESQVGALQRGITLVLDGLPTSRQAAAEAAATGLNELLAQEFPTVRNTPALRELVVGVAVACTK